MQKVTIAEVEAIPEGKLLSDGSVGNDLLGSLAFRRRKGVIHCYFRYTLAGRRVWYRIGTYSRSGRTGTLSLADARDKAQEMADLRAKGNLDLDAYFQGQQEEEARARETARLAEEAQVEALANAAAAAAREVERQQRFTLRHLSECYLHHLESHGKGATAKQARSVIKCHLLEPFPELASRPARDILPREFAAVIRSRLQGASRTPGQLRSYLHSAYNLAIRAELSSDISEVFIGFDITSNPLSPVPAMAPATKDRVLTDAELVHYQRHLFGGDDLQSLALLLHLYAAGQRTAQLLRARVSDWEPMTRTLRLWDGKGRRAKAREHLLPLAEHGAALVEMLVERARRLAPLRAPDPDPALFANLGAVMNAETLIKRCRAIGDWTPGDIRRTCETRLASLGVSADHRAQVLSHGISGIQAVRYDRHGYFAEKRAVLIKWEDHLSALLDDASHSP